MSKTKKEKQFLNIPFLNKQKNKETDFFNVFPLKYIGDVIQDKNGKYKTIFRVSPINGELLSDKQLYSVFDCIQRALATFRFRIGIYVQSEKIDVSSNVKYMTEYKANVLNELNSDILQHQINHFNELNSQAKYIKIFYITLEISSKTYLDACTLLDNAYLNFSSRLEEEEMYCEQLKERNIKKLLYERMNPESSIVEPIQDDWDIPQLLPENAVRHKDGRHITIENQIYRFYSINNIPSEVEEFRWLKGLYEYKDCCYIAFTLTPKDKINLNKQLSKATSNYNQKAMQSTDEADKQLYESKRDSAKSIIKELGSSSINLFDTNITIGICSDSLDSLRLKTENFRSCIASTFCQSTEIRRKAYDPFFVTLPILYDCDITRSKVWNLTTTEIASIIPFDSSEYMESTGKLVGENVTSGGIMTVDAFARNKNNPHLTIVADTGSGKTKFLMADAIRYMPFVSYTFMFDLKGDLIFPWANRVSFNAYSGKITNPFHIHNAIIDSDDELQNGKLHIGAALSQKVMDLTIYFKFIYSEMTTFEKSLLQEDILDCYKACGLTMSSSSLPDKFCTFSTLNDVMKEKIKDNKKSKKSCDARENMLSIFEPYITGAYSVMFNGQTNWTFESFTVFDLSNTPEDCKKPLYEVLFKDVWSFCKKDGTDNPLLKNIYLDEIHEFADPNNPQTLIFISSKLSKQGRGFGVRFVNATQNLPDLLSIPRYGQAVIDNAYHKFFMHLGDSDHDIAVNVYKFSEAEMKIIGTTNKKGSRGKGIFIVGSQKTVVHTIYSKWELAIVDPSRFKMIYGFTAQSYLNSLVDSKAINDEVL